MTDPQLPYDEDAYYGQAHASRLLRILAENKRDTDDDTNEEPSDD